MIEQGRGGRIIGASSVAGKSGQAFNMARQVVHSDYFFCENTGGALAGAYSASKFAVRGLTQSAG